VSNTTVESCAEELHRRAIVIDAHSDILLPIADGKVRLGCRFDVPDPATWTPPPGMGMESEANRFGFSAHTSYFGPVGQVDIPRMREGGVTVQGMAIYLEDKHLDRALARGLEMTWWLHKEIEDNPGFELVTTVEDIRRIKREGKVAAFLSMEGCEAIGPDIHMVDLYYRLGLRMASLTHNRRNLFADGQQDQVRTGGLTSLGKQLIRRMNELGIVIDLVHLNEVGFWEILEMTTAPVVYSHTSATNYARLGPDRIEPGVGGRARPGFDLVRDGERLRALVKNGGVLGLISFRQEDLDTMVRYIEFLLEAVGPDHLGLGADYYGWDEAPRGLEDISKLPLLTRALVERGHSDETILKLLGGNMMRVFGQVWKP
jgi:membrane dipeptidase